MQTTRCRILAEQIEVTFPSNETVLRDFSFQSEPGEFLSIVGPSGCGKSTVLRCLAKLQAITAGSLTLSNDAGVPPKAAYVFQDPTLLPWRSVTQNIMLPLELNGAPLADRQAAASRVLSQVGLDNQDAKKRPHMLSGGMQMRVSLGRALVTEPDLLLLDEPFGAIDDISRQQLNEQLHGLWREQRWTAVLVTHNVAEAVFLSQRVLVMKGKPARIVGVIDVPLRFPRTWKDCTTMEFTSLVSAVSRKLRSHENSVDDD